MGIRGLNESSSTTAAVAGLSAVLGSNPQGSSATVKARLDALEAKDPVTPEDYGAAAATFGSSGSVTSGQITLTDPSASFSADCVGDVIILNPTGYSSAQVTTIASRQSATQITLSAAALATLTSGAYIYGPDCASALDSMCAALADGDTVQLRGLYLSTTGGHSIGKRVKISGAGSVTEVSIATGLTGIAVTSSTANGIVESAHGIVMEDFGVVNLGATTPSAGAGISVVYGTQGRKRNVLVSGFYNNIDFTSTSGRYWTVESCKIMDPVNYGIYIRNTTPSGDECDGTITGSHFNTWGSTRTPAAAVRWEAGGGIRFVNNKINQGMSGPKWQYGLDYQVADGVSTGVMLINSNSIENCTAAGIRIGNLGVANTGKLTKIVITGNEIAPFGSSADGVVIKPNWLWLYTDLVIAGNTIRDFGSGKIGIDINYMDSFVIDRSNTIRGSINVYIGANCTNFDVADSIVNNGGTRVLSNIKDNAAYTSRPLEGSKGWSALAAGASQNLFSIDMNGMNTGIMVELTLAGRLISGAAAGPVARYKRLFITTTSGTPTVGSPLANDNTGDATVDITATVVSSSVQFKATHNATGSTLRGQVSWRILGPIYGYANL